MLKIRYSKETGQLPCGVTQGGAASMRIFNLCINPIIEEIAKKYICIAYADDLIIVLDPNTS